MCVSCYGLWLFAHDRELQYVFSQACVLNPLVIRNIDSRVARSLVLPFPNGLLFTLRQWEIEAEDLSKLLAICLFRQILEIAWVSRRHKPEQLSTFHLR